ncbi:SpoIIE family protein phosphatase [Nonomuraea spiralis]|uniref:SpoIIE family protein phosphatase n=1 Tax=Nonomuraea spiralis TaxID=46182 RepID=A0ABV5I507_9ACTN|nr:SpoIIE family protein phosphatase [Nonomuraea spiralis]GGS62526.1 transcription antitermination regulator [Nonomuraea spiralis]
MGSSTEETGLARLAATVERLRAELDEARRAADDRALVELAKGILVERLRCAPAQAAAQLATLAARTGRSLTELAADVVNRTTPDPVTTPTADAEAGGGAAGVRLRTAESAALGAADVQAAAHAVLETALLPIGATAVAVWVAGPDTSLTLAGHAGFGAEEAGLWRQVPPGLITPATSTLLQRRTLWHDRPGPPSIGRHQLTGGRVTALARVAGRVLGVLEVCWPEDHPQPTPRLEHQIEALADLCALTLNAPGPPGHADAALAELAHLADSLPDPAFVLVPHLDPQGDVADFRIHHANGPAAVRAGRLLLEAYPFAAGELLARVEHVHATGEPFHAADMSFTATSASGVSITRHGGSVLLVRRDLDDQARLLEHAQRLGRIGGFEENALTGEITWNAQMFSLYGLPPDARPVPLERLRDHVHRDDEVAVGLFLRAVLHHRRPAATAFRLERPDGVARHLRVVAEPAFGPDGRLTAVRGAYQDVSPQHWTEVALAVTRDRLARTERQSAARNRLALQLQHAIMPPSHGRMDSFGLRIAVRYRPAQKEDLVGGDWYDAVVLPSGCVLLSVGDVAGHGVEAATGMVVLRNALRGLATTGGGPAQLLGWLNLVARHLADRMTATAICGVYDPATRVLRWARAGHLPPILLRRARGTELPMVKGPLLGAFADAVYEEGRLQLEADDTLLLYTDGLIERRDHNLRHAQDRLLAVASRTATTLDHRLDDLLTHCNSDTDDDTCLIGVHVR